MSRRTPKPTPQEKELRELQMSAAKGEAELASQMNDIVQSQLAYYKAMEPVYLKEVGMEKITDPETGSVSYKYKGNQAMDNANEIERLSQERTLKALKGELPVDPALERDIKKNRQVLNQYLYKNLGEGFETSTPGIQLLSENTQRANESREAARRGELAGANALTLNAQQSKSNVNTNNPVNVGFGSGASAIGAGAQTYGASGTNAGNYQQPYQYDRNQQFQYNMAKYAAKKNLQGALIGGGMQMGAQALGGLAGSGAFSHPSFKKNIEAVAKGAGKQCLAWIQATPLYTWIYKDDPQEQPHLGSLTTEMPEILVSKDKSQLDIINYLGVLTGSIQELAKQVAAIEAHLAKGQGHGTP